MTEPARAAEERGSDPSWQTPTCEETPEPEAPPPRPGEMLMSRFLVVRVLGKGGSGIVFEAIDTMLGSPVAIKAIRSGALGTAERERLRREVRLVGPGHPDLTAIHDLHVDGQRLLLSMWGQR